MGGPKADARVAANQLQKVKASYAVINEWLIAMDVGGTASTTDAKRARKMARDRMKRSSTKTKNKWQPSNRWGKQKKAISPIYSEEEDERELDEGDNSDKQEQEDYDAMDVDGSEEDQLHDSDEDDEDDGDMEF